VKISVIIVTQNRNVQLKRCILSLINGTIIPHEIIVIDNNSTDDTNEVMQNLIRRYPQVNITYMLEPKIGISYARNTGLKKASGNIIAFTDDDCIVHKYWVVNIIKAHKKYRDYVAIGGLTLNYKNTVISSIFDAFRQFWTYEAAINQINRADVFLKEFDVISLATQNISYKKNRIKCLRFNEELTVTEAVDFSWQILKRSGKILYNNKMIVYHEYSNRILVLTKKFFIYGWFIFLLKQHAIQKNYLPKRKKKLISNILIPYNVFLYIKRNKLLCLILIMYTFLVYSVGYALVFSSGKYRTALKRISNYF